MSQVKLEQIIAPEKASSEKATEDKNALVVIDTKGLNKDSLELLNQIIVAEDRTKAKDLTQLFIDNQNKKTMVRLDSLSGLQDRLVSLLTKRVSERPDEMSNQEVMQALKTVQDLIDRSTKNVTTEPDKPLIQINTQTNNIGTELDSLPRESRDRARNAVMNILNSINAATVDNDDVVELKEDEEDD